MLRQTGEHPPGLYVILPPGTLGEDRLGRQAARRDLGALAHAVQDILIAGRREHLFHPVELVMHPRRLIAPQRHQVLQAIGHRLGPAIIPPEVAVGPLGQRIMQFQEIDDPAPAIQGRVVEPPGDGIHHLAARRHLLGDQLGRQFDQDDSRGLKRFQEPRRQPDGDAVPFPEARPMSRPDLELAHRQIAPRLAQIGAQLALGFVAADMAA